MQKDRAQILKKIIRFGLAPLVLVGIIGIQAAEEKSAPFWRAYEQQEPEQIEQSHAQPGVANPKHMLAELLAVHTGVEVHEIETDLYQADSDHARAKLVQLVLKSWRKSEMERNEDAIYRPYMKYRREHEANRRTLVRQSQELILARIKREQQYAIDRQSSIRAIGWNAVDTQGLHEGSKADPVAREQAQAALAAAQQKLNRLLEADRVAYEKARAGLQAQINHIKKTILARDAEYEEMRRTKHLEYTAVEDQIEARLAATKSCLNQFFARYMPGIRIR